jgi:Protein of unknown function (DUF2934)
MPNLEEAIRERAYLLWVEDGRPEGKADIYWLTAQREILAASMVNSDREAMESLNEMVATRLSKKRRPDRGYAWRRVG